MSAINDIVSALVDAVESMQARQLATVRDATLDELLPIMQAWLADNVRQPTDGEDAQPITDEQLRAAVAPWLAAHTAELRGEDGEGVKLSDVRTIARAWLAENVKPPLPADIQSAVRPWLEANRARFKGEPGKNGIGIESIEQPKSNIIRIFLTDGTSRDIRLRAPVGSSPVIGGGVDSQIVNQLIAAYLIAHPPTSGSSVPTTMQADFIIPDHTQVLAHMDIKVQEGQSIIIGIDAALIFV